ncbi:MAG: FAD:protein FMN transferase [Desulfobulbaceae bacterium]|nr:FAD:protein FMN transferase [Desulfobulbaceae bacterium]
MKKHGDKSKQLSRRTFLSLSASAALSATVLSLPIPCEAVKFNSKLYKVSFSRPGMGTFVNITIMDGSRDKAETAIEKSYHEMDRLISMLIRFAHSSPVSLLNRDGYLKDTPPELLQVLQASVHYNTISSGAFDITVLPILTLIQQSFASTGHPPSEDEVDRIQTVVGSHHLKISDRFVSLTRPGMAITLDSIAKGFIVDRIMAILRGQGIRHALVNAGGDIAVLGGKGDERPWRIAIQDPRHQGNPLDVLSLYTCAVAPSGSYEVFFDQEKLYHHLISPSQALPVNENVSVSVQAKSVMEADALATAVFVMGPDQGTKSLKAWPAIEGLIVNRDGDRINSPRWKS